MAEQVTVGQIRRAIEGLPDDAPAILVGYSESVDDVVVMLDAILRRDDEVCVHVSMEFIDDEDEEWDDDDDDDEPDDDSDSDSFGDHEPERLEPLPGQMGLFGDGDDTKGEGEEDGQR